MKKALVIVDMQRAFLLGLPEAAVSKLIGDIQKRAEQVNKLGWKVIPVEFQGNGPTIPDLTFSFAQKSVLKKMMGGGKQVLNQHPDLEIAEVVGVYSDQCVMCTASGLVRGDVKVNLNLDYSLPYYCGNPGWKPHVKEIIENYIGRYHQDTPGLFQII